MRHFYITTALIVLYLAHGRIGAADDLSFKQLGVEGNDADTLKVLSGLDLSLSDNDEEALRKQGPDAAAQPSKNSDASGSGFINSVEVKAPATPNVVVSAKDSAQSPATISKASVGESGKVEPKAADLADYIGAISAPLSWGGGDGGTGGGVVVNEQKASDKKALVVPDSASPTVPDSVSLDKKAAEIKTLVPSNILAPAAAQPAVARAPGVINVATPKSSLGADSIGIKEVSSKAVPRAAAGRTVPIVTKKDGVVDGVAGDDLDIVKFYSDSGNASGSGAGDDVQEIMEIGPSLGFVDWKNNIKSRKKKKLPEPLLEELSPLVYKKTYDDANKHLPSVLYEGDFKLMMFDAIAQNDSLALSHLIDVVGTADIKLASSGDTPLIYAVKLGNIDAVSTLIAKGAHIDTKNNSGIDALQMARKLGKRDLIQVINSMMIEG